MVCCRTAAPADIRDKVRTLGITNLRVMKTSTKIINRTVWILSLVSLFADVASEMLYPVSPLYLKEIGFSVLLIGVL